MRQTTVGLAMAGITALCMTGCGLSDRSMGSIFDGSRGNSAQCSNNDKRYADGSSLCRSGTQYRCDNGRWQNLGHECGQTGSSDQTCAYDGRNYASGKGLCQSGTMYRCDRGSWTNRATACGGGTAKPRPGIESGCRFNDVVVASQTTVCRSGNSSRCENGRWKNLRVACR